MSDIGLTGLPTTRLNKVGGMGEVQSSNNFPGIDAFGGAGPKIPQQQIDEVGNQIRNVDFTDMQDNMRNVSNKLQGLLGEFFGSGRNADLKFPLETENPAYQARVKFTVFTFKPKDGESQKRWLILVDIQSKTHLSIKVMLII